MSDTTYNGWTNYETWAVGMYLDGNYDGEGTYRYVLEMVEEICEDHDNADDATYAVENALSEFVRDAAPDMGASVFADLLGAALDEVNFRELAEHKIADTCEEES